MFSFWYKVIGLGASSAMFFFEIYNPVGPMGLYSNALQGRLTDHRVNVVRIVGICRSPPVVDTRIYECYLFDRVLARVPANERETYGKKKGYNGFFTR